MKEYDEYYVENPKLQDWLEEKGLLPNKVSQNGKVYYYKYTVHLVDLLDQYYIEEIIF
jgi:hypothetical protein